MTERVYRIVMGMIKKGDCAFAIAGVSYSPVYGTTLEAGDPDGLAGSRGYEIEFAVEGV